MNTSHPRVWAETTVGGEYDVGKLHRVFVDAGIPAQRNGRWLMANLPTHADTLETYLTTRVPVVQISIPSPKQLEDLSEFLDFYGEDAKELSPKQYDTPSEAKETDTRGVSDLNDASTSNDYFPPDMCKNEVETEAIEWLKSIVDVCFNTDTGIVMLENDLALCDRGNIAEWLVTMRKEWESRIHSGWLDQFMGALELWAAQELSKTIE